jgi:hypothetical protein
MGETGAAAPENRYAHPSDQSNGMVDVEGESGETADGEIRSAAERKEDEEGGNGFIPPMGGNMGPR